MTFQTALLPFLSAIIGGLLVAIANHLMTQKREREKKITDVRIEYLIDCCLKIESVSNLGHKPSHEKTDNSYDELEKACAKIMLLGDPVEVDAVREFSKEFATNKSASGDKILNSLRDNLRKKLGLEHAGNWDSFLRISRLGA
jgi:hypothetical protein